MTEPDLESLSREDLKSEVVRLRAQVAAAAAGRDEPSSFDGRRVDLSGGMSGDHRRLDSERRQRAVFDSAVDIAMIVTDRRGTVTEWNIGAERIFGWSGDEMRGQTADRMFTPEDRAEGRVAAEMRLALRDGRAGDERWHLRKDGGRLWASGAMMPLRDEDGTHLGFTKIVRDRTAEHAVGVALREAEMRLRESEDHFRHTVELNPQVPWTCDPHGNITSYSNRWLELTGQAPGEPLGAGWANALHPDDLPHVMAVFAACLASGEPVDVDYRIRVPVAGYRWMRARAYPRRNADGTILRWYGVVEDIDDRRRAEDALRISEARYRGLFDTIDQGFCVIQFVDGPHGPLGDYVHVEANQAFEAHSGIKDGVGRRLREIVEPEEAGRWLQRYGEVLRTGRPARFEEELTATGRALEVMAHRVEPAALGQVAVLFADISERKRAEAALKASEARLRAIIETAPVGVLIADETGAIVGGNARTEEIVGHPILNSRDTAAYGEWCAFHADGRRVEARDYPLARVFDGEARPELECHYQRGDGRRVWMQVVGAPVRDEQDNRLGAIVAILDIDRQKQAEQALQALNASLENEVRERTAERDAVWTLATDLLTVTDFDGNIVACNPAWSAALGWSEAELKARPFFDLVHPDDMAATTNEMARLIRGEPVDNFENRYRHKDGSYRWLSWNAVPSGGRVFSTTRDVTVFKAQAESLAKAEEQLRQAQKMEAVGQLTGGLAHDFNNLLAGISGGLEMIGTRIDQGRLKDVEKYMVAAQGAARRAAALTHRLLAFSRRQTLAPKATDVNALVDGMLDLIQRTVGPAIRVEVVGAATLWPALVDPSQLENALLNLCINARDAMPDGGRITIETSNRWIDRHAARQNDMPEGQYLSMSVSDTGAGMAPDVIAKAFDPFFTTKPLGEGTGLGLSMIYGFAKQSGGQVRIYSEVGEGTMVRVYLPRHRGDADADEAHPDRAARPVAEAGETVLVVDDEPTVRMLVTDVLEDLGYTAIEASDGAGGLKVLQSDARIDLLVTDVGLPGGMNGRQMADAARVTRSDLRVLFITGFAENALLNNGQVEPGMAVLTKPFAVDVLAARIRELIAE